LVADFQTHMYVRLLVDGQEIDLTAYTLGAGASVVTPRFSQNVWALGGAGGISNVYWDQIAYTDMEP